MKKAIFDLVGNKALARKFAESAKGDDSLRHIGFEAWLEQLIEGIPVTAVREQECEDSLFVGKAGGGQMRPLCSARLCPSGLEHGWGPP